MRLFLIAFAATTCFISLFAGEKREQISPVAGTNWISTPAAKLSEEYWASASWSDIEWVVETENGRVFARRGAKNSSTDLPFEIKKGSPDQRGTRHAVKVADGWLAGWNAGEWGGSVWWFAPDGNTSQRVSKHQVIGFYPVAGGILAPAGLAHLGISEGKLIKFTKANSQWSSGEVANLQAAPQAASLDKDDTLIIATTERLLRVKPSGDVTVLLPKTFWGNLYPNSMVIDAHGDVWIGMRHGITKVGTKGSSNEVLWLVPDKSYLEIKPRN